MSLGRDDRFITNAQGTALAGAQIFYCTEPASTPSTPPPSPLANIYSDSAGAFPITQPVITDGFGHSFAYMDPAVLYCVVIYHPLFGQNPVVLPDQAVGNGQGTQFTPFEGILNGTINGTNKVFTLTNNGVALTTAPAQVTVWVNFPLVLNVGYTISGVTVTFTNAPQVGDSIYAQGLTA